MNDIKAAGKTSVGLYLLEGAFMVATCFLSSRTSLDFCIWVGGIWLLSLALLCLLRNKLVQSYCVMIFATMLTAALYPACGSLYALLMVFMIQWLGEVFFLKPSSCIFVLLVQSVVMGGITLYEVLTQGETTVILDFFLCVFVLGVSDLVCLKLMRLLIGQIEENSKTAQEKGELVKELEVKVNEAQAATRAKSEFLANMSHEIRTPINAILGMNEVALRECRQAELTEYLQNIATAGKSLLAIINDVLDFSKIEAGQMKLSVRPYEMQHLINNAVAVSNVRAEEKRLSLIFNVSPKTPRVLRGDIDRIGQIFNNLTSNALKYTDRGSVTVSVWTETHDVPDMVELYIRVSDTGIGIRKEDINKLFISFQRLDAEANRAKEGTGLGLALTSRLVSEMGGEITVDSNYGVGSVFTAHFPQGVEDSTPMGNYSMEKAKKDDGYHSLFTASHARVLVVDDNNMNLMVVNGLLKPTQVQVTLCTGGEECLKLMKKEHFDIILLDHMMPRMDGIEVLTRSREMPDNLCLGTPIIALTANAVAGSRERYIRAGFDDYLAKPVNSVDLERLLLNKLPPELLDTVWDVDEGRMLPTEIQAEEDEASPDDFLAAIIPTEAVPEILPTEAEYAEEPAEQRPIVDKTEGLKYCAGLEDMYSEILELYLEEGLTQQERLNEQLENRDWGGYAIGVHSLKSNSKTIGALNLAETALMMEKAAKAGEEVTLLSHHEELMQEYAVVLEEVRQMLGKESPCTVF